MVREESWVDFLQLKTFCFIIAENPLMRSITLNPIPTLLTYHLRGSLLPEDLGKLDTDFDDQLKRISIFNPLRHQRKRELEESFFLRYDELLDTGRQGPTFLADPVIQRYLIDSWLHLQRLRLVSLLAVCIMPNHVHVILSHYYAEGQRSLDPILRRHKRFTGKQINERLDRKGRRVWAQRQFDWKLRGKMLESAMLYLVGNPVRAGLVPSWRDWPGIYLAPVMIERFDFLGDSWNEGGDTDSFLLQEPTLGWSAVKDAAKEERLPYAA